MFPYLRFWFSQKYYGFELWMLSPKVLKFWDTVLKLLFPFLLIGYAIATCIAVSRGSTVLNDYSDACAKILLIITLIRAITLKLGCDFYHTVALMIESAILIYITAYTPDQSIEMIASTASPIFALISIIIDYCSLPVPSCWIPILEKC